jgi:hypothetical protein
MTDSVIEFMRRHNIPMTRELSGREPSWVRLLNTWTRKRSAVCRSSFRSSRGRTNERQQLRAEWVGPESVGRDLSSIVRSQEIVKTCPQCGGETVSLIHNLRTGRRLCWRCTEVEPSKLESEYPMQDTICLSPSGGRGCCACDASKSRQSMTDSKSCFFTHRVTSRRWSERFG